MKKIFFILTLITLLLTILIVTNVKILDLDIKNITSSKYGSNDEKTPRNQEWEMLDENVFFKRTGSYYIIEKHLLRVFYVMRANLNYDFKLSLISRSGCVNFTNGSTKIHQHWGSYKLNSLNFNYILSPNVYDESFWIYIQDLKNRIEFPLKLKVKYIRSRPGLKKDGSIICSKCYYFRNDQYKDFEWWIKLNQRIGYKKIIFCNNSIPNNREYNEIFLKYKHLIELSQLNSIPNFVSDQLNGTQVYLKSYLELKYNGKFFPYYRDIFEVLYENECFLNNAYKYEHISILDNDETIIPRSNKKILKNKDFIKYVLKYDGGKLELENSCASVKIDQYLNSIKKSENLHFLMGFYLSNNIIKHIFNEIEAYISSGAYLKSRLIKIIDPHPVSLGYNPYNYTFLVNGNDDLNYVKNLLFIYKKIIEIWTKNAELYGLNIFNRIFFIAGSSTSNKCGKTSYHSDKVFDFTVHYPDDLKFHWVDFNIGHSSHFRETYTFRQINISITEFMIDFNYFYCYFKPIVENK
jgi:hypothetical protein